MAIAVKRATVTVDFCADMDLLAKHEALNAEFLQGARRGVNDDRLTGDPVAREIQELEKQMEGHVHTFTLRALPAKEWSALKALHPPREDDEVDGVYGVNLSTFVDVAMPKSIVGVTLKASGESVEWEANDWVGLADEMSNGQWEAFALKLIALNTANVGVPFSSAASKKITTSGEN